VIRSISPASATMGALIRIMVLTRMLFSLQLKSTAQQ
jgi:hypothetical protein